MIEQLSENDFSQKVIDAPGKVLVEFFATWCPHCQRMMPVIGLVADRLEGEIPVYQADIDKCPQLAQKYAPNGVPTFLLFEDGVVKKTLVGEQSEQHLQQLAA